MTALQAGRVRVSAPATSANLGPGFDALGLALGLRDEVIAEASAEDGVRVTVVGEGADDLPTDETHLVARCLLATLDRLGVTATGISLMCHNTIPQARGLGSSSAAIVAGVMAARVLHPQGDLLDDSAAYALATEIEGHPDNVAPCLAGGLTIAWTSQHGPKLVRLDLEAEVVVLVPDQRVATERARGLLPATVSHADAAANSARAALLIAALTQDLGSAVLLDGTEDRLHQSYRAPAMPESVSLVGRLREAGVPAVISGAGPTVLAFTTTSQLDSTGLELGTGWHKHPLNVDPRGARVQPNGALT